MLWIAGEDLLQRGDVWVPYASVIAVDLTRKDFGLPVVRVVVPGLEPHADPRHYYVGKRARSIWEKTN
jgi:ribosomal protein S12 methylthiotransferase accessory factor YcaO